MDFYDVDYLNINSQENICSVCGKKSKHYKIYKSIQFSELKEVEFVTAHAGCRSLLNKIRNTKNKLNELECELYIKKNNLE